MYAQTNVNIVKFQIMVFCRCRYFRIFLYGEVLGVDNTRNPLKLRKHLKFSRSYNKHRARVARGVFAQR